jgi:quercetin dioxygenase-like cupin family protein
LHVRASAGITKWNSGDEYSIKATADQTGGALGFVVATVPPGSGPTAHAHANEDEAFYLINGELEFLNGDQTFVAGAGDFVFIPRNTRHRFKNISSAATEMLFLFTPGGQENFFVETGDDARPGENPEPWGPERYGRVAELIEQFGNVMLPEDE